MAKRLSDDEKKRRGTYRADRSKQTESLPKMDNLPEPKDFLSRRGAVIYYEAAQHLNNNNLLNDVIAIQVNAYANEMDKYLCAIEQIEAEGETEKVYTKDGERFLYFVVNPLVKIANMHLRAAMAMAKQLLIMPVDRDKLPPVLPPESENPFANL